MLGNFLNEAVSWKKEISKRFFKSADHANNDRKCNNMTDSSGLNTNRKRYLSSPKEKSLSKKHKDLIQGDIDDFITYLDDFEEKQESVNIVAKDSISNMAADNTATKSGVDTGNLDLIKQMHSVFAPYFEQLQLQIKNLEVEIKTKDKKIEDLEQRVDNFEQQTHKIIDDMDQNQRGNNIRIHGLAETEGENTDNLVIKAMKDNLNIDINPMEISDSYRIGKLDTESPTQNRPIIVKLTRHSTRNKIYKAKKELKTKDTKIYVNEDLTPTKARFFKNVRDLKKERLIQRTWTSGGKVFYLPNNEDIPKEIVSQAEVDDIRKSSMEVQ